MLLILDEDITSVDLNISSNIVHALDNILASVRYGCHFLLAKRVVADWLLENVEMFSLGNRGVVRRLSSHITQNYHLKNMLDVKLIISATQVGIKKVAEGWRVGVDGFINPELLHRTDVVCEDLDDCKLYKLAARGYKELLGIQEGVIISCAFVNGGGANTANTLRNCIEANGHIALCVVDSDKKHPTAKVGDTAHLCKKYVESISSIIELVITESREAENIVPTEILIKASRHVDIDKLKLYEPISNHLKFIDFKNGVCVKRVNELVGVERRYYNDLIADAETNSIYLQSGSPDCAQPCNGYSSNDCVHKVFPSLGRELIEHVIEHFDECTNKEILDLSNGRTYQEWIAIGKKYFEWCFAQTPVRT